MSLTISIDNKLSKEEKYLVLEEQVKALVFGEENLIANLSNIMSALKYGLGYFWVGIYKVENNQLVLGPFQGPVACTRIPKGKGVCGTCWEKNKTIIVEDVEKFPGHISCSSESKSEIVLPIRNKQGNVAFVLDIDSNKIGDFNNTDQVGLERIVTIIETLI